MWAIVLVAVVCDCTKWHRLPENILACWKYLEWPTNEDIKYISSLVIMQAPKPSPVSIYTCIAKLKATVGQGIAAPRVETNQMWHVLTALMYNDLSSFLRERSLAHRRSEGSRARNASQSSGALILASVTWNKTRPFSTIGEKGDRSVSTFKAHILLHRD